MNDTLEHIAFRHPKKDPDTLKTTHELQRIEVAHEPAASFSVLKPISMAPAFASVAPAVRPGESEPLAAFVLPTNIGAGVRMIVSAQTLLWEVDPLEWMRWLATKSGWTMALAKVHPSKGGPRYELGCMRVIEGHAMVRRTIAVRSGSRLVRCDVFAPLSLWPQWHDVLWTALESFALGSSSTAPVEELALREGTLLRFAVPGSWDGRARGQGNDGVSWALQPIRDVQRGMAIKVHAQPADCAAPAQRRREGFWRAMADQAVRMGAVLRAERVEFAELIPGWVGQWQAAVETSEGGGVVLFVQREHEGVAVDYALTAPAAGTAHVDWMRGTRALDVVIATSSMRGAS